MLLVHHGLAELLLRGLEQYYSVRRQDPAHNWSQYIDNYIGINRFEPIIKEWFKWSCESVTFQSVLFYADRHAGRKNVSRRSVAETARLHFCLALFLGDFTQGHRDGHLHHCIVDRVFAPRE